MPTIGNQVTQPAIQEFGNLWQSISGGNAFYVGTTAQIASISSNNGSIAGRSYTDMNSALGQCVSGRGDTIYVLPGYTENVTATSWSNATANDVTVVGMGRGSNRPSFTWTVAGSTIAPTGANFRITNCILGLEPTTGTVTVTAPLVFTTAGCSITNCKIATGTDSSNKVTIGITCTAATDFEFGNNVVRGAAAATMTTFLRLVNCANPYVHDNDIICGTTSAAVGPIQELTTACTGINISNNTVQNNATSSTACITMALASTTGWIASNFCRNMTDGSNAQIVVTSGDVQLFQNYGVNNSNETGILLGTPSV